jgi:hypothetical protein
VTSYGNSWYCYHWTFFVYPISLMVKTFCEAFYTCMKHNRSLFECMETDWILNSILYFSKNLLRFRRVNQTWVVFLLCWKRFSSISCFSGQSVYCHPPWSLVLQCAEHLLPCQTESQMNTKTLYVLFEWPQFIFATANLKLLRQISKDRLLLKKRHT